jgi:PAS domain-containing protein
MSRALNRYLCQQLGEQLLKRRVVVFYDPRREFEPFFDELEHAGPGFGGLPRVFLDTEHDTTPHLARFDGSFFGLRAAVEPVAELDRPEFLIVYLPGVTRDRRGSVLMELEKGGTCYEPQLKRLARNVLREFYTDGAIDELLASDKVTYRDIAGFLEQSTGGGEASMLRTLFGGASSEVLLARWLADPSQDEAIAEKGATDELLKLVSSRLGLELEAATSVSAARGKAVRYVLANEFRADLMGGPPASLSMIPTSAAKEHLDRVREVASRLRAAHADTYVSLADKVEAELSLRFARVDPAHLGSIETFRFEEQALLAHVAALIAKKAYTQTLEIILRRSRSFWVDRDVRRRAQWEACRLMAELGQAVEEVRPEVSQLASKGNGDATRWVEAYARAGGWHRVDLLQRSLEAWIAKMDDEPEADQARGVVRRHHEDLLKKMASDFSRAFVKAGWTVPGALHQMRIYPEVVERMSGRVAYFFVDAMRYEMGVELTHQLQQSEDVTVRPAIAALPSITPMGMAALLPGESSSYSVVEHKGHLAARIGDTVMPSLTERMRHLRAVRPEAKDLDLGELLQRNTNSLKRTLEGVPLLVVRSQSIDGLGEMDGGLLARHIMDTVVGNIARAVRKLAKLGFDAFVVTADHGHQFSVRKDEDMMMDKPGGNTVDQHRRCWAGHGGQTPPGCLRVTGAELGYDSDLEFIFPEGLAVFRAGGDLAFHHGGISLQELVIPVVTLRLPSAEAATQAGVLVRLAGLPEAVTNRTFGVRLRLDAGLFQTEPVSVRVVLVSGGEEVGQAGMALNAELDRVTGILRVEQGKEASVGLMLTRDDCKTVRVVAQDPVTDAVLEQSEELPVRLGI